MWLAYFLIGYILLLSFLFYAGYNETYLPISKSQEQLPFRDLCFVLLTFGLLLFLSMFRGKHVGSDTLSYISFFKVLVLSDQYASFSFSTRMEPGFVLYTRLLASVSKSPQIIIIVSSVIIMISVLRLFMKYSRCLWLSIFVFFCLYYDASMNIMRQFLAMSILMWAYDYLKEKRKMKFVIAVLLASTFHYTAVFFIIAYPLLYIKINRGLIIRFLVLIPITVILSFILLHPVLNVIHKLGVYEYYNSENKYIAEGVKIATVLKSFMYGLNIYLAVNVWNVMDCSDELEGCDEDDKSFFLLSSVGCIITIASLPFNIFSRVGIYFSFFSCLLLSNTLAESLKHKNGVYRIAFFVIIYILYYLIVNTFRPGWSSIYPYEFY